MALARTGKHTPMPEFILNLPPRRKPPHAYYGLDEFSQGYVEAMFFTNGDCGDDDENLLNDLGVERLTKKSVAAVKKTCGAFLGRVMPDGCFARQWIDRLADRAGRYGDGVPDDRRAGHMFWYSRQGHGVAWTDDFGADEELHGVADGLQEAGRGTGEQYVEVSAGWIDVR